MCSKAGLQGNLNDVEIGLKEQLFRLFQFEFKDMLQYASAGGLLKDCCNPGSGIACPSSDFSNREPIGRAGLDEL